MNELANVTTMTSREIAEYTGKRHSDVLEAIRTMEPAWVKVNGRNFPLVEYKDAKGEMRPEYRLSKIECLYVATKFNDEARARLILRWEELEQKVALPKDYLSALKALVASEEAKQLAEAKVKELEPPAQYAKEVLDTENAFPITHIAKELGMSAIRLNKRLHELGVQHKVGGVWILNSKYGNKGYTKMGTTTFETTSGEIISSHHTYWTEKGRQFIHELIS